MSHNGGYILETRGLTKEFKGFVAVNDVNLKVTQGTIHALIGPNGAGKTTCFNLLTHFLEPTRGQIFYESREITGASPAEIARMGVVRSFQISAVFPHLIVGGIVTFSNPRVGGIILGIGAFLHWYLLGFSQAGKLFVLPIGATAVLAVFASPSTSLFKRLLS